MKSYTTLRNLFGSLTNDNSSTNLTLGDQLINDDTRLIAVERDYDFMQKTWLDFTVGTYTTGEITDATHNSKSITGSGTSWTSSMIGRQIQIGGTGDNNWYEIATVPSGTTLTLTQPYNGATFSGATNGYTIRKQFYDLPYDYDELIDVTVTIGSNVYTPKEAPTRQFWDQLNSTNYTSTYPEWFFIFNGRIGLYPCPSATGYEIAYSYDRLVTDLSIADYTTGTIDSATNGSSTITGSGTSWTSPMAGRYLRINATDSSTTSGDEIWYQIRSVESSTSLTLMKAYQGTTIGPTSGANYTIGQMSVIPEPYQDVAVYGAAFKYYTAINPDPTRAKLMEETRDRIHAQLIKKHSMKTTDVKIQNIKDYPQLNPNLVVNYGS